MPVDASYINVATVSLDYKVSFIGNGDIKMPADAVRMLNETSCDAIMIGRGSFGQPWIFEQTKDLLAGRPMRPTPSVVDRFAVALDHARMVVEYQIDPRGAAIEFRKHLGWYVKGLPSSADLRRRLYAVTSFDEVEGIFGDYLRDRDRGMFAESADDMEIEAAVA